jgi:hypothetical protein
MRRLTDLHPSSCTMSLASAVNILLAEGDDFPEKRKPSHASTL